MINEMKSVLALMVTAAAVTASAATTTNTTTSGYVLQGISVNLKVYGASSTKNITPGAISATKFVTEQLGGVSGDVLVRATPIVGVTNTSTVLSNLTYFTNVIVTNVSTNEGLVTNYAVFGTNVGATSNLLGTNGVSFSTNTYTVGSTVIASNEYVIGTNSANATVYSNYLGSNLTYTVATSNNVFGVPAATIYTFYTASTNTTNIVVPTSGAAFLALYDSKTKTLGSAISTNTLYIHEDSDLINTNLAASVAGEVTLKDGQIISGVFEDIRTLVFSNASYQFKLRGHAAGHYIKVATSKDTATTSSDYVWESAGSGVTSSTNTVIVLDGTVSETFLKYLSE